MKNPSELFALSAITLNAEYCLQIVDSDHKVLVTVGEPAGCGKTTRFCIWIGEPVDCDGNEAKPYKEFYAQDPTNLRWRTVIQEAYRTAIDQVDIG